MVTVFIDSKAISESDVLNVFHSVYLGKPLDQNKRESMKWFADEDAVKFLTERGLMNDLNSKMIRTAKGQNIAVRLAGKSFPEMARLFFSCYPIP